MGFLVAGVQGWWWLAVPLAVVTFLAAFVQLHDAMHNALGLSRRANEAVITLAGLLLLKSGHGLRASHLRHHGHCLNEDDPEGKVVHWSLWRVVLAGPFHVLGNRTLALRLAPRTARDQLGETALNALFAVLATVLYVEWGTPVGLVYWAVVAVFSSTLALWAAYLPHVLPAGHPIAHLGALARVVGPELAFAATPARGGGCAARPALGIGP